MKLPSVTSLPRRVREFLTSRRPECSPGTWVVATRVFTPEAVAAAFRQEALVRALAAQGRQVTVMTTTPPSGITGATRTLAPAGGRESTPGVAPVRIARWPVKRDGQGQVRGYVSYLSFDIPLAFRLLTTRNVAGVVAEPPPTTGLVVAAVCALRRLPYTFYAADIWSDATQSVENVPWIVRAAVTWMELTVWDRAACVLTISEGVDDRVKELLVQHHKSVDHVVMVGNGIDTDTFTHEGDLADEEAPYFVYAGTVSEWQGADIFLDAFARIRKEFPTARLLFFSEGSGRDALAERVRREGITGVEFRGKVSPSEVSTFLRGAVAGLSSIVPGTGYDFARPTKMYAATGSGTPIIHVGAGAAADLVRENGLGWAAQYDEQSVASAMREALEGTKAPSSAYLREWTVRNVSLAAAAQKAAQAVLEKSDH